VVALRLDSERLQAFDQALAAMAKFRSVFGRGLKDDFIAELYVAKTLSLEIVDIVNQPGYDAVGPAGERYQVKCRSASTLNVDTNNFDFDYLVLVNLREEDYQLLGMWLLTTEQARSVFTHREKFRKYQATQAQVKRAGKRLA
jgi:hypothetical protein